MERTVTLLDLRLGLVRLDDEQLERLRAAAVPVMARVTRRLVAEEMARRSQATVAAGQQGD